MSNIQGTNHVHLERVTTHGIYPKCNQGLLVGTVAGSLKFFHGTWKATDSDITCPKCKIMENK